jgi:hypothetical protein
MLTNAWIHVQIVYVYIYFMSDWITIQGPTAYTESSCIEVICNFRPYRNFNM